MTLSRHPRFFSNNELSEFYEFRLRKALGQMTLSRPIRALFSNNELRALELCSLDTSRILRIFGCARSWANDPSRPIRALFSNNELRALELCSLDTSRILRIFGSARPWGNDPSRPIRALFSNNELRKFYEFSAPQSLGANDPSRPIRALFSNNELRKFYEFPAPQGLGQEQQKLELIT